MTVRDDAVLNYPLVLSRNSVAIGHVQVGTWPNESTGKVELTGHDSAGAEESMPDGILRYSPAAMDLVPASGVMTTVRGDMTNKTVIGWSISDGIDTVTFSGWVMNIEKNDSDGNSPDAIKYKVTIQPTGPVTWS